MISLFDQMFQACTTQAELIFSGRECSRETAHCSYRAGTFHFVHTGTCALEIAGCPAQRIDAPALIFFPSASLHRVRAVDDTGVSLSCAVLSFSESFSRSVAGSFPEHAVVTLAESTSFLHAVRAFFGESESLADGSRHMANRLGDVVLCYLAKALAEQNQLRPGLMAAASDPRIAAAIASVHNKFAENLDVDSLAADAHMSRSRFIARFRQLLNTSPHQYLLQHRMDMARQMLRKGLPVKIVAERVGYGSLSAFVRQFKSIVGQPPGTWAK